VAHVGRRGLQQRDVEACPERPDERPQLVVGGETVEVDEPARQVVRLDDEVGGGLVGAPVGQPFDDVAHHWCEGLDELRDRRVEPEVDPHRGEPSDGCPRGSAR